VDTKNVTGDPYEMAEQLWQVRMEEHAIALKWRRLRKRAYRRFGWVLSDREEWIQRIGHRMLLMDKHPYYCRNKCAESEE
jgi:hypothetical protein